MYSFIMFYIFATTMYVKVKSFERKYITLLFFFFFLLNHTFAVFLVCVFCWVFLFFGFFFFRFHFCLHASHALEQKNRLKKKKDLLQFCYILAVEKACISSTTPEPQRIIHKTCMERVNFVQMRRSSMPAQFHRDV